MNIPKGTVARIEKAHDTYYSKSGRASHPRQWYAYSFDKGEQLMIYITKVIQEADLEKAGEAARARTGQRIEVLLAEVRNLEEIIGELKK